MEKLLIVFLYLISILWLVMGVLLVFATGFTKDRILHNLLRNANLKKRGVIPIIIGVLLLLSAPYNRYAPLVVVLGILGVIKGITAICATEKMEKMIDWWLKPGNTAGRLWGIALIIIGAIVLIGI